MMPLEIRNQLQTLCKINAAHQSVEFLRQANQHPDGTIKIVQNENVIEWSEPGSEFVLLLWTADRAHVPMDDVKPQWDVSQALQEVLKKHDRFPNAILWAPSNQHALESPWQATHWWPLPGVTDAVDAPDSWLAWWWNVIMQEHTQNPSIQSFEKEIL